MSITRISTLLLAALLALPCSLPVYAAVSSEMSRSMPSDAQAAQEKTEQREKLDQERAKAYQPGQPPAKPKKPQEIIIHTN